MNLQRVRGELVLVLNPQLLEACEWLRIAVLITDRRTFLTLRDVGGKLEKQKAKKTVTLEDQ